MIVTDSLTTTAGAGAAAEAADPSSLGRDEFLQMLIAQLENQDPLNPQDATEFTAQLATFSSLEQLLSIGDSIDGLVESQNAAQRISAAGLIGRDITAAGSQIAVAEGGLPMAEARFQLTGASTDTTVNVFSANNTLVRSIEMGPLGQGEHAVAWDGLDGYEQPVPAGIYSFRVSARSGEEPVEVRTQVRGRITGAIPGAADPLLMIGDLAVPLSQVQEVREAGFAP